MTGQQAHRRARAAARLHAVQALFQMEASGEDIATVRSQFETHRFGAAMDGDELAEADAGLFRALIEKAVERQARIDQMADHALVAKWPIARIDPVLRALFRAAGAELVLGETPPRVVIAEFLEVARAFSTDPREVGFVNGVLDHMARKAQPGAFA